MARLYGQRGLRRVINGTDEMLLIPAQRNSSSVYEPEVWGRVMAELRAGDTFVDVGAFIGFYTVASAKRVGPSGKVVAFEPNPESARVLREHVTLNNVAGWVLIREEAVGAASGATGFALSGIESRINADGHGVVVPLVTLDEALPRGAVHVLKIDVEGFEEQVIQGARSLLTAPDRRPRAIFIEVHPFAWHQSSTTSASFIRTLKEYGYRVQTLGEAPVPEIVEYGEVMAVPGGLP
jgi:FkbM family methyltransferase